MRIIVGKVAIVVFGIVAFLTAICPLVFAIALYLMVKGQYTQNPENFKTPITISYFFSASLWKEVWLLACEIWALTIASLFMCFASKKWILK